MNTNFLNAFIEIVSLRSISKAAENLGVSQSALSQQIKSAEQALDCSLLVRSRKGVELTDEGAIVYRYALKIVENYNSMTEEVRDVLNSKNKTLSLYATPIIYAYALPHLIHEMNEKYPLYQLEMITKSSFEIEQIIKNGEADVGLITDRPQDLSLYHRAVIKDPYYLVAHPSLDIPNKLTMEELSNYKVLMLKKHQKCRQLLDGALRINNFDPSSLDIPYEMDTTESIKTSAVRGYGLAFLPYMSIKKELQENSLKIINLEGFDLEATYYMIRKNMNLSAKNNYSEILAFMEASLLHSPLY